MSNDNDERVHNLMRKYTDDKEFVEALLGRKEFMLASIDREHVVELLNESTDESDFIDSVCSLATGIFYYADPQTEEEKRRHSAARLAMHEVVKLTLDR